MAFVATLVADPSNPVLTEALAAAAAEALGRRASGGSIDWLAPGIACDIALGAGADPAAAVATLRDALAGSPVDVAVQAAATRRKSILIADMDSTMIDQECIDELAAEVGLKDHVAAITARAMNGEIDFEPALRERVALLAGLSESVIETVISGRITLKPGGRELVATMRANGSHTALVSGGFTAFTGPVAAMIGFDENRANILIAEGGRLAGSVAEPILGKQAKVDALVEIAARLGRTPADAIAVGDGANDLGMIALAGTGVALHAKPAVAAQADIRIDHADLTALLYLQGYRQGEIIAP